MTGLDKEGHPKVLSIEPAAIPCGVVNYREQGMECLRLGRFAQAKKDLNIAFDIDPSSWRTAVAREEVALQSGQFQEALEDAQKALTDDPDDIDSRLIQARALYNLGEFEKALMVAYRGWKRRKLPPEFAHLIFAAQETIEDCVGSNVGPIMMDFLDLIAGMEKEREMEAALESRRREDPCLFPEDEEGDDSALGTKEQRMCRARLQAYMCCKYLGRLCQDLLFLLRIDDRSLMEGPTIKTIDQIMECVKKGIEFLRAKQDQLHERRPLYSIRYTEAVRRPTVLKRKKMMLKKQREVVRNTALALLETLRQARMRKDYKMFFHTLERCYEYLTKQTKHVLPKKKDFQDALYTLAGIGLLDMKTLRKEDSEERRQLQAQMIMEVRTPHGQAIDAVLSGTLQPRIDIKKRMRIDEERLRGSESNLERAWLYCNLCNYSVEERRFEMVRFYGRKCIAEAKTSEHWAWCINAVMHIARSEMKQNNRAEALHALDEALEFAQKLKNESVLELLFECMEVVKHAPPDVTIDPVKEQENKIISMMMGDDLVDQAKVLLQCIAQRLRTQKAARMKNEKAKGFGKPANK